MIMSIYMLCSSQRAHEWKMEVSVPNGAYLDNSMGVSLSFAIFVPVLSQRLCVA